MKIPRSFSRTLALAAMTALGAGAAHAQSITPTFTSATGAAGNVTYTYDLFITSDTKTVPGDLFTFYDFNGLLTGGLNDPTFTADPAVLPGIAYTISVQNTGLNPPNTTAIGGDDPSQPNVSLTETGTGFSNATGSSVHLGTLVLHSTNIKNVGGDFTPFAANTTKISSGAPAGNEGAVSGPNIGFSTPEPGTWAMFVGMGISGLAFTRRKRRK